ncbi:MAG: methylenetetrahydrofolate reductase [NAD(P)H], partial [Pirellula sp.]
LFPPKKAELLPGLRKAVEELQRFGPDFFTCTYGAGGATRSGTLGLLGTLKQQYQLQIASHLTCVGSTIEQLRSYLDEAKAIGVDYIVALRGDPPKGESQFTQTQGGLRYANELVSMLRSEYPEFGILVAGYPEVHQEAPSAEVDLENLKRKVDSGADVVVTQLFYNNEDFYRFRDRCQKAGIRIPIIPGVLPVISLASIQRIASLCKAALPQGFVDELSKSDKDDWQFNVGTEFATKQVADLIQSGIPGIHFYVLNSSRATSKVLDSVGWKPS